ncbi:MAG TPA: sulfotransferase domain-containing protein [Methylotenera sp.]
MTATNLVIHIGGMRTGSTFLQSIFAGHSQINLNLKSRYFSYDPYFYQKYNYIRWLSGSQNIINIDSDENYSLGRFKSLLLDRKTVAIKSELEIISHDLVMMADRLKTTYPNAKILMVIREQTKWIQSVYKHDIQHFGLDIKFDKFLESELGKSYINAADYFQTYNIYANLFGKDNVKLFLFEDLQENPQQFLDELFKFIGVNNESRIDLRRENQNLNNATLYLLRFLNRFSQKSLNKSEYKFFIYLRKVLFLNNKFLSLFPDNESLLFDQKSLNFIKNQHQQSNLNLESLGFSESILRKYKYIV